MSSRILSSQSSTTDSPLAATNPPVNRRKHHSRSSSSQEAFWESFHSDVAAHKDGEENRSNTALEKLVESFMRKKPHSTTIEQPIPPFLINPNSLWKQWWDIFVTILTMYTVLSVPYFVSFNVDPDGILGTFDRITDACFIIDVILTFNAVYIGFNPIYS